MKLSKLTIYGFKSFADKLELEFGEGITAVVGPNGCGKTNIVDAIKWAMGEQKPTSIRGRTMEDVIFNGSVNRKPLGFAEVSLTVDNAENLLPVDVPEVTVTRRLFRSGESEYLINNQQCRLRDIHDLFMDTGIGNNSYTVMQQEMVDVIISDKTDERRVIFEEAAGIQKYKSRRRETQHRLRSTEQDLLRLGDIIAEVEKAVRSLKRQVNRAKRFQKYRDRLSIAEVHLALLKDRKFEQEMKPLRDELRRLRESREGTGAGLAQKEAAVAEARTQAVDLEKVVAELQRDVDQARERVRRVEAELIALRERRTAAENAARHGRGEAEEMDHRRSTALQEHQQLDEEREQAVTELKDLQKEEEAVEARLEGVEERLEEAQTVLDDLKDRHNRVSTYYQDEAQRAEFLRFKVKERGERIEALRGQQAQALVEAEQAQLERTRLAGCLEEVGGRRDELRRLREETERAREVAAEDLRAHTRSLAEVEGGLQAATAERDVVKELLQGLEGVDDAVRDLRGSQEEGFGLLLAEVLQVDEAATPAAEAVLGPALEGLLLLDDGALTRALDRLMNRQEGGRAVLLAPHLAGGAPVEEPGWARGPGDAGVGGRLADYVRGEGLEARVARGLLSRVLWVESLDQALDMAANACRSGWTLVTSAGEVVAPGGYICAGRSAAGSASGLLTRRHKLEELNTRVDRLKSSLVEAEAALRRREDTLVELRERSATVSGELESVENTLQETEWAHNSADSRHETLTERASELGSRIGDDGTELDEDKTELQKLSPLLSKALEESGELGGALEDQQRRVEEIASEQDKKRHLLQEMRLNRVRLEHRIEGLQREMKRLATSAEELAEAAERRRGEAAESEATHKALGEEIGKEEGVLEQRQEVRRKLEGDLEGREKAFLEHRNRMQELEEELRNERRMREGQQERVHSVELRLSELGMRRENLAERIREEYDVNLGEVGEAELLEEGAEPPTAEVLEEEVLTLRERLDRLGPVNLLALEEYETEKQRFDFLEEQRTDLEEAKQTLQQTIRKINKTARKRFMETFEEIRSSFRKTYAQFFEGGEADIYLGGEEDPLEARIEIVARPKGKILKNMAALSGGEKALTAIALLFAIYLVKPSPFCILDEVDASLDEANIGRFLRVINLFEEATQFILITHNNRTMEASDTFLGITMEEPGVSKVVGVRFDEEAAA